jgi:hypothetical protein
MTLKNRLKTLEKQSQRGPLDDIFTPRIIDYRAGIVPDVEAAANSIPVYFADYRQEVTTHDQP